MRVLIIGARKDAGLAALLDILSQGGHEVVGLVGENIPAGTEILGHQVLGDTAVLPTCKDDHFVVNIGANAPRKRFFHAALAAGLRPCTLVHKTAYVGDRVSMGEGCVIHANAAVISGTRLGLAVVVNAGVSLDHDNLIGDFVNIGPGTHTGGRVTIQDEAFIGVGASVIPDVVIGEKSIVGAGTVVIRDVPSGRTVAGNPARAIK